MQRDDRVERDRPRLQSLAQAARGKNLNAARGLLIVVGVLTLLINGFQLLLVRDEIRKGLAHVGQQANPQAEQIAVMIRYGIVGSALVLGAAFIGLGLLVKRFPVPVTILSLLLYLGATAFYALLDPATLLMGIVFKIIIVVSLFKAIQSAFAYQKELALEPEPMPFDDDPLEAEPAPAVASPRLRSVGRAEEGIQAEGARPPLPQPGVERSDDHMQAGLPQTAVERRDDHMQAGLPPPPGIPLMPRAAAKEDHTSHTPVPTPERPRSTRLFDQEFRIHRGRPWTGYVLAMMLLLGVAAIGTLAPGARWAALPGCAFLMIVCSALFFLRRTSHVLRFTETGVEMTRPKVCLDYSDIVEIFAPERHSTRSSSRNFPIHLLDRRTCWTIPATVEASSEDLYQFLRDQPLGANDHDQAGVPAVLRDFLKQQLAVHGPAEIYIYRPRQGRRPVEPAGSLEWLCLGILGAALAVIPVGLTSVREAPAWLGIGIPVAVLFGLIYLLALLRRVLPPAVPRNLREAMLIIGPDGLAMTQGDLTGELRWRELKAVKTTAGMGSFQLGGTGFGGSNHTVRFPGITLTFAGASMTIADIYHWPLAHAQSLIEEHWGGRVS